MTTALKSLAKKYIKMIYIFKTLHTRIHITNKPKATTLTV